MNLLPEAIETQLDLASVLAQRPKPKGLRAKHAIESTVSAGLVRLAGNIDAQDAVPTKKEYIELLPQTTLNLPANSLTVISF